MTNYNDGNWHGWNGGECPVHPKTRVQTLEEDCQRSFSANGIDWKLMRGAFRVVKEYREPRDVWVNVYSSGSVFSAYESKKCAEANICESATTIHFREVIE